MFLEQDSGVLDHSEEKNNVFDDDVATKNGGLNILKTTSMGPWSVGS
jgi:hypothetical protein